MWHQISTTVSSLLFSLLFLNDKFLESAAVNAIRCYIEQIMKNSRLTSCRPLQPNLDTRTINRDPHMHQICLKGPIFLDYATGLYIIILHEFSFHTNLHGQYVYRFIMRCLPKSFRAYSAFLIDSWFLKFDSQNPPNKVSIHCTIRLK